MTDNLATIVAMNYSMEAAALYQAMESIIISELPNIMARWDMNDYSEPQFKATTLLNLHIHNYSYSKPGPPLYLQLIS